MGIFGNVGAIDIDHCIDENGELSPLAFDVMDMVQGYTEYSPSGHGLRILLKASGFHYDKDRYYIKNPNFGIEVYIAGCTKRFVTVTGNALTPGFEMEERGEQLAAVLEKYMVRPKTKKTTPPPDPSGPVEMDDVALIEKAKKGRQRGAVCRLVVPGIYPGIPPTPRPTLPFVIGWRGGPTRTPPGWIGFSAPPALMREKWDRRQSGSTYGAITIQEAIASCSGGYDPQAHSRRKAEKITTDTTNGPVKLADLAPDKNSRYGWSDIGNGNLFADWYKNKARYVPERKRWYIYNGKVWEPDSGNLRAMELCKDLADALAVYALSIQDEKQRVAYQAHVGKWQRRTNRETILKDAASVHPVSMTEFDQVLQICSTAKMGPWTCGHGNFGHTLLVTYWRPSPA